MGFEVRRTSRSYVLPAAATPAGSLELSAIDRVVGLRHMVPSLHVYPPRAGGEGDGRAGGEGQLLRRRQSPATVIREALEKALVDYYPLAGRLVDGPDGPASARVECTGEGAWFVEAVAGCSLEDVGRLESYPFAVPEGDLLPDEAPGVEPVDLPLMMQVTEFTCGGFVVGLTSSHAITDGLGAGQFINAIADYARGLPKPRVAPIWSRGELVPNPPKLLSCPLPVPPALKLRYLIFDLSFDGIEDAKSRFLQSTGQRCSTFDVAIAKLWQARTRSLRLADPSTRVSLGFFANTRHLLRGGAAAAAGFYGNCFYTVTVVAESGAVVGADLAGVIAMIRDAKAQLPAEFARWAAGERVEPDPYDLSLSYESLFVTDWTRLGFTDADHGWGTPSLVVPFAFQPFMPKAVIGAPPAPKAGARITTQCVEEVNLPEFRDEMEAF